jgi:hypothetical protein
MTDSDRTYAEQLQDRYQRMRFAGDALATALSALASGNQHEALLREIIRLWDEAKRS